MTIAIIGSGKMGFAYRQAVQSLGLSNEFEFYKRFDLSFSDDSCGPWLNLEDGLESSFYDSILLAIPVDQYPSVITRLGSHTDCFLLEKPGFANLQDYLFLSDWCSGPDRSIYVLFNRRFYKSVRHLRSIVNRGSQVYVRFCFDDRISLLADYKRGDELKRWAWFNSVHVIDLAYWIFDQLFCEQKDFNNVQKLDPSRDVPWHEGWSKMKSYCVLGNKQILIEGDWTRDGSWRVDGIVDDEAFSMAPLESFLSMSFALDANDSDVIKPGLADIIECTVQRNFKEFATLGYCRNLYDQICKIANY